MSRSMDVELTSENYRTRYKWGDYNPKLEIIGGFTVPANFQKYRKRITKWVWETFPNCRVVFCGYFRSPVVTICAEYPRATFSKEDIDLFESYMDIEENYIGHVWNAEGIVRLKLNNMQYTGDKRRGRNTRKRTKRKKS